MRSRTRLDELLLKKEMAHSRSQAQALILAGHVKVNGVVQTKAGALVPEDAAAEILQPPPYVGRGGLKLEKALQAFRISPEGKVCLDVGASTGGFTDCLLQHGAAKVYAVDVGRGQLAWNLRRNSRVISLEKVNARYLSSREIPEKVRLCAMDVSFISVKKILPAVRDLVSPEGEFVILVKPQFEAGARFVKKGIVKDKGVHMDVMAGVAGWGSEHGFSVQGATYSPITGGDGNIEFFLHLDFAPSRGLPDMAALVEEAHGALRTRS